MPMPFNVFQLASALLSLQFGESRRSLTRPARLIISVLGGFVFVGMFQLVMAKQHNDVQAASWFQACYASGVLVTGSGVGAGTIHYGAITGTGGPSCDYADLEVEKTVNESKPNEGDTIVYTIVVTNNGPNDATSVRLTDRLPKGITYVSHSASPGTYLNSVWTVDNLNNTAHATLNITATVDRGTAGEPITNTIFGLAADQSDPNSENNEDSAVITPSSANCLILFVPIILRDHEPCRFYDFSFYEGDWLKNFEDDYTLFGYVDDEYRIVAKSSTRTHLAWPKGKYENYRVSAKVRWFDGVSKGTKYGLTFGIASDLSSFYTFMVYPATQAYEIKYYNGSWSTLYSGRSSAIASGLAANYLSVQRLNGTIGITANNTSLGIITATQISGRRYVGIGVGPYEKSHENHNAHARFDDYEICPLTAEDVVRDDAGVISIGIPGLQGGSVRGDGDAEVP